MNAPFDVLFVFHFVAVLASSQSLFIRENYHGRAQPQSGGMRGEIRSISQAVTRSKPKDHANGGQNERS